MCSSDLKALEAIARNKFDLVIMDVQMPEMNGLEAARLIRAQEKAGEGRLPIIAMTAHAMKGDEARCLSAGMDGYVSKPIEPDEFFDVIERHLDVSSAPSTVSRND